MGGTLSCIKSLARLCGQGKIKTIFSKYKIIKGNNINYDDKSFFLIETDKGFNGTVI